MKRKKAHKAAEQEAFEEAGLIGLVGAKPLGVYKYLKRAPRFPSYAG
jgi:hypothetical protein